MCSICHQEICCLWRDSRTARAHCSACLETKRVSCCCYNVSCTSKRCHLVGRPWSSRTSFFCWAVTWAAWCRQNLSGTSPDPACFTWTSRRCRGAPRGSKCFHLTKCLFGCACARVRWARRTGLGLFGSFVLVNPWLYWLAVWREAQLTSYGDFDFHLSFLAL